MRYLLERPGLMESSRQRLGILAHQVQPRSGDANSTAAAANQLRLGGNLEEGVPIVIGGLVMDIEVIQSAPYVLSVNLRIDIDCRWLCPVKALMFEAVQAICMLGS